MSLDLALMVFDHIEGAERAYAHVLETSGQPVWVHELAFVEHHRHDRVVVRGTFAGRYVDVDERGDVIGKRTAEGALTGAIAGFIFGPAGLAVGLVAGSTAGGLSESGHAPHLHDAFLDEVRAEVPERSSALLLLAEPRARRRDGRGLRRPRRPAGAPSPDAGRGAGARGRRRRVPPGHLACVADEWFASERPHTTASRPAEFVELAPGELSGVFSAPSWLRDLGMMSWLLVGVAVLMVGVAVLLSLTNAIVAPVVTAAIIAAVLSPLVAKLQRRGLPRAAGAALVFLAVVAVGVLFAVLILGGVASQAAELEGALKNGAAKLQTTLQDAGRRTPRRPSRRRPTRARGSAARSTRS